MKSNSGTEDSKNSKPYSIKHTPTGGVEIEMNKMRTMQDVMSLAKELIAPTLQSMLDAEMTEHLGYEKHDSEGNNSGNSRNGYSEKTLKTSFGPAPLKVPRDRNGTFEPVAVRKYETIDNDVEERIISMYAKGMTTRDIEHHMNDLYGVSVSAGMVSTITDKVLPLVKEWQSRPLPSQYVFVYLDGIHFKIRDTGRIVNKCAYTVLGITSEGTRDILGLWIGNTEGAKFWLSVLTEIKNRGVEDMLLACVDGLAGFSDAIKTVFPNVEVQQCIIHLIRNTIKHLPHKDREKFCRDLRNVYTAPTEEAALEALLAVQETWPQYAIYLKRWETMWHEISPMFKYPSEIRRMIYTTNTIENLHRQFRKVTKTTTIFPHEESLQKLLWLAQHDITRRWNNPLPNWGIVIAQLAIMFPDRVKL